MHELREVMLTAYALGELSDSDRHAVEAELATDAEAQMWVASMGETAALLQAGLTDEAVPNDDVVAVSPSLAPRVSSSAWGRVPSNLAHRGVGPHERALEIKVLWGSSVLDTVNVDAQPAVTIGDAARTRGWGPFKALVACDLQMPARNLPARAFPIVERTGQGAAYTINLHGSFAGYVERVDGSVEAVDDLRRSPDCDSHPTLADVVRYELMPEETVYVQHGHLTLQVRYVRKTAFVPTPFVDKINHSWVSIFVVAFFAHLVAVAAFVSTPRISDDSLALDVYRRAVKFVQVDFAPGKPRVNKGPALLAELKSKGQRAPGIEGRARRDEGRPVISRGLLDGLFRHDGDGPIDTSGSPQGGLQGALDSVLPVRPGANDGVDGFGTRGVGPGGGGPQAATVVLGHLDTRGKDDGYGDGVGQIERGRERDELPIAAGDVVVRGAIDRGLIRNVVRRHRGQIRYCYERGLMAQSGLHGKVSVEWTIVADGSVSGAKVIKTTLGSTEVEDCLVDRVLTWRFPPLVGGGIAIIRYPFVFKTSG